MNPIEAVKQALLSCPNAEALQEIERDFTSSGGRLRGLVESHRALVDSLRAALPLLEEAVADRERLDWLEERGDDVTIRRDLTRGKSVVIDYCSEHSGCPCNSKGKTLRAAIDAARAQEGSNA